MEAQHYAHTTGNTVDLVLRVAPHSVFADPYASEFIPCPEGVEVGWLYDGSSFTPPVPTPVPSQFEKDQSRYQKRAAIKDELMAYMAADNMGRVRSGVWSVADLTSLLDDPHIVAANSLMATLSFELAAAQINAATTPLLTPEIRADWTSRLEAHYYLEG